MTTRRLILTPLDPEGRPCASCCLCTYCQQAGEAFSCHTCVTIARKRTADAIRAGGEAPWRERTWSGTDMAMALLFAVVLGVVFALTLIVVNWARG